VVTSAGVIFIVPIARWKKRWAVLVSRREETKMSMTCLPELVEGGRLRRPSSRRQRHDGYPEDDLAERCRLEVRSSS
jgi:hypothetical protein